MNDKRKNDLAKNTTLLTICTVLNKGIGFILIPLFSRWLTTEEYGTFDVLSSYASLLVPVITLSCADALFRFCMDEDTAAEDYITNSFLLIFFDCTLFGVILLMFNSYYNFEYIGCMYLLLLSECFDNMVQGYERGIKRLDIYGYCKTAGVLLIGIFTAFFVLIMQLGVAGITLGYAMGYFLSDIFALFITKFRKYFNIRKYSFKTIKKMLSYSWILIPNSLSWWVMNASDRLIISAFLNSSANGIYAISSKVPTVCSSVFSVFSITWQQTSTEMINEPDRADYFNDIFNKMIVFLITLCTGVLSLNYYLFYFIFDVRYLEGRLYTPILVTSAVFLSLAQYFGGIEIALKRPKENSITTILGAIVNFIINISLIKWIGLYAAAVSTLIANLIVMLVRKKRLSKLIPINTEKKILPLVIYYLYIFTTSFLAKNITIVTINVFLSGIIFFIANKQILLKLLKSKKLNA